MKIASLIILFLIVSIFSCGGKVSYARDEVSKALGSRGYACFAKGDFDNALSYYQRARFEAANKDLPQQQSQYLFNIGRIYYEKSVADSAQCNLINACYLMSFDGDSSGSSLAAGLIALLQAQKGNFDSADIIYKKYAGKGNKALKAFWQSVNARILVLKNDINNAQPPLDSAIQYYQKEKDNDAVAGNYLLLANIYLKTKRYPDASTVLRQALVCLNKTDIQFRRWKILLTLSETCFLMGDSQSGMIYYLRAKDCIPSCFTLPSLDQIKTGILSW